MLSVTLALCSSVGFFPRSRSFLIFPLLYLLRKLVIFSFLTVLSRISRALLLSTPSGWVSLWGPSSKTTWKSAFGPTRNPAPNLLSCPVQKRKYIHTIYVFSVSFPWKLLSKILLLVFKKDWDISIRNKALDLFLIFITRNEVNTVLVAGQKIVLKGGSTIFPAKIRLWATVKNSKRHNAICT